MRDKRPCSKAQTPPRPVAARVTRSLARGIVSCSVAPAPTGVAQFCTGRELRSTWTDGGLRRNASGFATWRTRAGDIFPLRDESPHLLPAGHVRTEPLAGAPLTSAHERSLFARQSPEGRRHRLACSSARSAGDPAYSEGNKRKNAISRTFAHRLGELAGRLSLPVCTVRSSCTSESLADLRLRSQRGVRYLDRAFPAGSMEAQVCT